MITTLIRWDDKRIDVIMMFSAITFAEIFAPLDTFETWEDCYDLWVVRNEDYVFLSTVGS